MSLPAFRSSSGMTTDTMPAHLLSGVVVRRDRFVDRPRVRRLLILALVASYNRFVRQRNLVQESWRQSTSSSAASRPDPNLVETGEGLSRRRNVRSCSRFTEARTAAVQARAVADVRCRRASQARNTLGRALAGCSPSRRTTRTSRARRISLPCNTTHRDRRPNRRCAPLLQRQRARAEHPGRGVPVVARRRNVPVLEGRLLRDRRPGGASPVAVDFSSLSPRTDISAADRADPRRRSRPGSAHRRRTRHTARHRPSASRCTSCAGAEASRRLWLEPRGPPFSRPARRRQDDRVARVLDDALAAVPAAGADDEAMARALARPTSRGVKASTSTPARCSTARRQAVASEAVAQGVGIRHVIGCMRTGRMPGCRHARSSGPRATCPDATPIGSNA